MSTPPAAPAVAPRARYEGIWAEGSSATSSSAPCRRPRSATGATSRWPPAGAWRRSRSAANWPGGPADHRAGRRRPGLVRRHRGQQGGEPGTGGGPGRHPRRRRRRRRGDAARCARGADPVGAAARAGRHLGPDRRGDYSHRRLRRELRAARRGRRRARVLPHRRPRRPLRPERPDGPRNRHNAPTRAGEPKPRSRSQFSRASWSRRASWP